MPPGAALRPHEPYRSPPPLDSIFMPFAAIRSSDHDECGVQAVPNHVQAVLQHDDWADDELRDHDTDSTLVDGKHDGQRDPNAVHAVPLTPPAKPRRPYPLSVEASGNAWSPARELPARELQLREAKCASPLDTLCDRGTARALAVQRKHFDKLRARMNELAAVRQRILTLSDDAAPLTPARKRFAVPMACEDDADALKKPWWLSSWHDVLCGVGGGGGGVDRIDELDVDSGVEGGMCCACDFIGTTTAGDAAPVEKEREEAPPPTPLPQ